VTEVFQRWRKMLGDSQLKPLRRLKIHFSVYRYSGSTRCGLPFLEDGSPLVLDIEPNKAGNDVTVKSNLELEVYSTEPLVKYLADGLRTRPGLYKLDGVDVANLALWIQESMGGSKAVVGGLIHVARGDDGGGGPREEEWAVIASVRMRKC